MAAVDLDGAVSRPRIILIAYHFPPSDAAGAARAGRFYRFLPEFGVDVDVVTANPLASADAGSWLVSVPGFERPTRATLAGLQELVFRKFLTPSEMSVFWGREAAKRALDMAAGGRYSAIVSSCPPGNVNRAALRLKRRARLPWIADFRDPMVGNSGRVQSGFPARLDRYAERKFLGQAQLVIANTDAVFNRWRSHYPEYAHKIRLLWNGFDPESQIQAPPPKASGPRVIVHTGTIYRFRHPFVLLDSVKRLVSADRLDPTTIQVQLVGLVEPWNLDQIEREYAGLIRSGCVALTGIVDRPTATQSIRESHCLLLLDMQGESGGLQLPSKVFDYVQIGRPILAFTNRDSPVTRVVQQSGILNEVVFTDDSNEIVDGKVLSFLDLPTEPRAPSKEYLETFDGRRQAGKLADMIRSVVEDANQS